MINTNPSNPVSLPAGKALPAADCQGCGSCAKCAPQDRVSLGEDRPYIPTAVKLYDMSPYWYPKPTEYRIPMGVHGLC